MYSGSLILFEQIFGSSKVKMEDISCTHMESREACIAVDPAKKSGLVLQSHILTLEKKTKKTPQPFSRSQFLTCEFSNCFMLKFADSVPVTMRR